nr:helix-turn-helix domain-containing protein [uncultured Phocaeicola sp.]
MAETENIIIKDTLDGLGTDLDISRLLRDKSLTFVRISDLFGFSSPAYFSRYVQQHLGVSPTEYRG